MSTKPPLPSYDRPPVIEVAMSVQFEQMVGFDAVRTALLWERFRDRYPVVEQKAPIASQVERLGVHKRYGQVEVEFLQEPSAPRLWFVSNEKNDLVQVQVDRFARNWRRTSQSTEPYPRYEEHVRPRFVEDYRVFHRFLADEGLSATFSANQCEVTYINDIRACDVWSGHAEFHKVFSFLDNKFFSLSSTQVDPWENVAVHFVRVLKDAKGEFVGRLHMEIKSLFQKSNDSEAIAPFFRLTLTARGRPIGEGQDGAIGFMDFGRSVIVQSFDQLTTPAMHAVWGKRS